MVKVKNKKAINNLAKNSFKYNKFRNIFAIIAVVLTTILFTTLFITCISLTKSMEKTDMRRAGSNAHGSFKSLTEEQYNQLKTHNSIVDMTYSVLLGSAENKELIKEYNEIIYFNDELAANLRFCNPTTGTLPKNKNEIATDTIVLDYFGIPYELGQQITLEYTLGGKKIQDTFTLVGFWEGDIVRGARDIVISKQYGEEMLKDYESKGEQDYIGKRNSLVNFSNSYNIENKMIKVLEDNNYTTDDIDIGINWAYVGGKDLNISLVLATIVIIFLITFTGYLIISNIFYISIFKDIKFYGLLKTIGTTNKQIKYIVKKQALYICVISIPIGMILGALVSNIIIPKILSMTSSIDKEVSYNLLVFILSAIFTIITVFISIFKPIKFLCKITPIEAIRKADRDSKNKKAKKRIKKVNMFNMATSNINRNIKKLILVCISLSLGFIVLNISYSLASSLDLDKYLEEQIYGDFSMVDGRYFSFKIELQQIDDSFFDNLQKQQGIKSIDNMYFVDTPHKKDENILNIPKKLKEENITLDKTIQKILDNSLEQETLPFRIYGLDDELFNCIKIISGSIDLEKLKTGKYVVVSYYGEYDNKIINYYEVGEKVLLNGKEYEVLAIGEIGNSIGIRSSHVLAPDFYLPTEVFFKDINSNIKPTLTSIQVEEEHLQDVENYLIDYTENINPIMRYSSKEQYLNQYEREKNNFKIIGLVISTILIFIGIANFTNTIISSIMSRKYEIAILQSIGMTNKQVEKMFIFEGTLYILISFFIAITFGSAIQYLVLKPFTEGSSFMTYNFVIIPSFICLFILLFVGALIPLATQRLISKNSIIERLREFDN